MALANLYPTILFFRAPADAGVLPENTFGKEAVETIIQEFNDDGGRRLGFS
ncbi:hypothetical protein LguiB_020089 [Lonicera macranthoides]